MRSLIRDTARLDIFDLSYSYSSEKYGTLRNLSRGELPRRGLPTRIVSFFLHLFWAVVSTRWKRDSRSQGSVVFFASTSNQRDSISSVARHVRGSVLLCTHMRPGAGLGCDEVYSLARAYLLALPFLPLVVKEFWKAEGYRRESFFFWFDEYWLSYGHYLSARLWMRRVAPRSVVTGNDHTMTPRTLAAAARDEGVPTIYLQHGAGSTRNPPLAFDFALLDGRDSLGKFEAAGATETKVFLIGKPRSDANHGEVNTSKKVRTIGICTNYIDPIPRVEEVCEALSERFESLEFKIRPHPRDNRKIWTDLAQKYSIALSDPRVESPFEFLRSMDAVIAGDSSIHVEAALMNSYPLFFDYPLNRRDTHDFQAAGLIDYVSDVEELCSRVGRLAEDKPDVRSKAKPFIATVGTSFDGRSGELGARLVEEISSGEKVGREGWKRIPGVLLEAYELAENP